MTDAALGSPLLASSGTEDSALQTALRGGPRAGENWSVQSLMEVCLQRVEEVGCRGAASDQDLRGNRLLVVTDAHGHGLAVAVVYGLMSDDWTSGQGRHWWRLRRRNYSTQDPRDMLDHIATDLAIKPGYIPSLPALFASPYDDAWLPYERLNTCLGLWWGARMAEGHSVESAETLLALMSHPSVTAQFAWRRDDGYPQLRTSI